MDLDDNMLRNIIYNLDSTRIIPDTISKSSLVSIAKQVVTRALQFDPMNKNLIDANDEVLKIEEKLNNRSRERRMQHIDIVSKSVPYYAVRTSR